MNKYLAGFIAGFIGTIVLSLLMLLKAHMGILPEFDVIQDVNNYLGNTDYPILGWIAHFGLGTVIWGGLFVLMIPILTGPFWLKGVFFGIIAWFLMMIGYMPMMAHGFFALQLGIQATIMTLVLHIIYGLVLGAIYGWLPTKK